MVIIHSRCLEQLYSLFLKKVSELYFCLRALLPMCLNIIKCLKILWGIGLLWEQNGSWTSEGVKGQERRSHASGEGCKVFNTQVLCSALRPRKVQAAPQSCSTLWSINSGPLEQFPIQALYIQINPMLLETDNKWSKSGNKSLSITFINYWKF